MKTFSNTVFPIVGLLIPEHNEEWEKAIKYYLDRQAGLLLWVSIYIMEDNSNADAAGGVKDDIVECLHQFEILRWR